MDYDLIIQTNAILEVKKAFEWYENENEGLGYEFLDDLDICYKKIRIHPERYSYINPQYRRIRMTRFPYFVFYEIEESDIIVANVRHEKRKTLFS